MAEDNFYAYISRMRYITRWALMRNTFSENIQEHSHMVAVLAHALAVIKNKYYGGTVDEGRVAVAALYHDASEILTGDMPTPIKYYNESIQNSYKAVESIAQDKLLEMLPEELRGTYYPLLKESDEEVKQLVKAADKMSAYIKCVEELKAGNSEFKQAAEQTRKSLAENAQPEVAYFMEHFMPAFEKSLDELK